MLGFAQRILFPRLYNDFIDGIRRRDTITRQSCSSIWTQFHCHSPGTCSIRSQTYCHSSTILFHLDENILLLVKILFHLASDTLSLAAIPFSSDASILSLVTGIAIFGHIYSFNHQSMSSAQTQLHCHLLINSLRLNAYTDRSWLVHDWSCSTSSKIFSVVTSLMDAQALGPPKRIIKRINGSWDMSTKFSA